MMPVDLNEGKMPQIVQWHVIGSRSMGNMVKFLLMRKRMGQGRILSRINDDPSSNIHRIYWIRDNDKRELYGHMPTS